MGKHDKFIDLYQVLKVWPTASVDQIKKAYFQLAKLHHPDIVGKGEDKASIDFKLINEAFAVLGDPARRREYDERMRREGRGNQESKPQAADKRSAQLAYEQARTAMKHNRYDKAVILLKSAIKYDDSNPAYHSWYGFALGALKTRLHEARDACKKALETEFYNADYHANLGYVYQQAGLKSTARESFREALKWDPEHALALKHMQGETKAPSKTKNLLQTILGAITGNPPKKATSGSGKS